MPRACARRRARRRAAALSSPAARSPARRSGARWRSSASSSRRRAASTAARSAGRRRTERAALQRRDPHADARTRRRGGADVGGGSWPIRRPEPEYEEALWKAWFADPSADLTLIETFGRRDGGFVGLADHLARLEPQRGGAGVPATGRRSPRARRRRRRGAVAGAPTLAVDGAVAVPAARSPPPRGLDRAARRGAARPRRHLARVKSSVRGRYDRARAGLPAGTDEWLFLNSRGEVCEGTITNARGEEGCLLTPPSPRPAARLLRARLLREGGRAGGAYPRTRGRPPRRKRPARADIGTARRRGQRMRSPGEMSKVPMSSIVISAPACPWCSARRWSCRTVGDPDLAGAGEGRGVAEGEVVSRAAARVDRREVEAVALAKSSITSRVSRVRPLSRGRGSGRRRGRGRGHRSRAGAADHDLAAAAAVERVRAGPPARPCRRRRRAAGEVVAGVAEQPVVAGEAVELVVAVGPVDPSPSSVPFSAVPPRSSPAVPWLLVGGVPSPARGAALGPAERSCPPSVSACSARSAAARPAVQPSPGRGAALHRRRACV